MKINFNDFKQFNLINIFQLHENALINDSMVDGMMYITIDDAFKDPELLVDFLKCLPADTYTGDIQKIYDEGVRKIEDLDNSNDLQIRPPGLQQKVMSEILIDLSFNYYRFLVEQDLIPPHENMYEDNFSPYMCQSELSGFTTNTQLYYPGMLSVGGNNNPTVDKFQYMFKALLSDDIEDGKINFYKLNCCGKYWSSITQIMNEATDEEKQVISKTLNEVTSGNEIAPFKPKVDDVFEKFFSIEHKFNRLLVLPGDYFYDVQYDSTKETNCRFSLETGFTDMSSFERDKEAADSYYD